MHAIPYSKFSMKFCNKEYFLYLFFSTYISRPVHPLNHLLQRRNVQLCLKVHQCCKCLLGLLGF